MSKHILFVDTLGRLLIGRGDKDETRVDGLISISNPAIVHAIHKENGGLQITIIPIVFREFLADKDAPMVFDYARSTISIAQEPLLDARIIGQYEQMFSTLKDVVGIPALPNMPPPQPNAKPVVHKLFDN